MPPLPTSIRVRPPPSPDLRRAAPQALCLPAGAYSRSYTYDAFGNIAAASGGTVNPYRYVGSLGYRRSDSASGLLHLGAREYNPATGRFLTQDPIGYTGGLNLYGYVGNNPTGWVDPDGLKRGIVKIKGKPYVVSGLGESHGTLHLHPYGWRGQTILVRANGECLYVNPAETKVIGAVGKKLARKILAKLGPTMIAALFVAELLSSGDIAHASQTVVDDVTMRQLGDALIRDGQSRVHKVCEEGSRRYRCGISERAGFDVWED